MALKNVYFAQKCVVYDSLIKKILILKRSDYKPESAGLWDFVGGSYDYGENSKEGLIREGEEELKVKLNNIETIEYYANPADMEGYTFIFGLSFCDNFSFQNNEIKLSDEHIEFKWIGVDELNNFEFMGSVECCKDKIKPFIERFY